MRCDASDEIIAGESRPCPPIWRAGDQANAEHGIDVAGSINCNKGSHGGFIAHGPGHDPVGTRIREGMAVRRLTPRECERLQGFSDDYTLVPYRGKPAADGPRYKALGNSMAVPCMAWIGQRIDLVEALGSVEAVA